MDSLQKKYSKQISIFLWLSLAWVSVVICTLIFFWEGQDAFFLLWGLWQFVVIVFGVVLCFFAVITFIKGKKKVIFITLIILLGSLIVLISGKGIAYGTWSRFYITKLYYDYKVKNVLASKTPQEADIICNGICRINRDDDGRLRQIIFPLGTIGGLFGWQAFVYDPVGGVIQSAKAWQGDTSIEKKFQGRIYFGCALTYAKHLTGNWYSCSFWHD